ncbi:MAG: M15 family metallopeptidase [Melioribacteraceae bacterium]|nr:M15 family metallopeptidase [Melioribacteraceae bacterium]
MNDENNLSIGIRARILPVIEGADQLKTEISNLPSSISSRMQETIQSPAFREGLSTQQIKKVESLTGLTTDSYEFEKIQERQKEITDDLQIDLDRGKLTLAQQKKHLGRFAKYGQSIEGYGEFVSSELDDPRFDFLSQSQKGILRASATQGTQEAVAGISGVNQQFEQINYANEYVRNIGKLEKEQFQRHKNLEFDLEEGGFTKARGQRYLKEESSSIRKMEEMQQEAKEKFGGTEFGDRVFKTMGDDIEAAKLRMKDFADEIEKAGKESGNLLQSLKAAGALTLAGMAVDTGLNYWLKGKQIEAAERTSFDLTNPMSMYSARQQYEVFKETTERSRQYETGGMGIGLAGGLGLAALAGVTGGTGLIAAGIAGAYFGSSGMGKLAEGENVEARAKVEENLKFMNQSYGELRGYVNTSSQYDILRARTRARLGDEAVGRDLEVGSYLPEQRLQMRSEFADSRGVWDKDLYKEQMAFAGAMRIDQADIFKLDSSARMTGMDVGVSGLKDARQTTQELYGSNASPQKIIEVLSDIKRLNEELLKSNVNMDTREALAFSKVPEQIFGVGSAYGRMGDMGMETVKNLEGMMQPKSLAHEAFLYSALGTPNIKDFTERMKSGIMSGDNFIKTMEGVQRFSGGNEDLSYFMMNEMMPNAPAGMLPKISAMLGNGKGTEITRRVIDNIDEKTGEITFAKEKDEKTGKMVDKTETVWMTFDKLKKEGEEYAQILKNAKVTEGDRANLAKEHNQLLLGYSDAAKKNFSETEVMNAKIRENMNAAADHFRATILGMDNKWVEEWNKMADSTEARMRLMEKYNDAFQLSLTEFRKRMMDNAGVYSKDQIESVRKDEKKGNVEKVVGEELSKDFASRVLESIGVPSGITNKVFDIFNGGSIGERIKKGDEAADEKYDKKLSEINDAKKFGEIKDSGEWKNIYERLNKDVEGSQIKDKYKFGILEGYDATQKDHGKNNPDGWSKHFDGTALDITVYDEMEKRLLSNKEIGNKEDLKKLLREFARTNNLEYGGDYGIPDYNHLEQKSNSNLSKPEIDYERLEHIKKFEEAREKPKPLSPQMISEFFYPETKVTGSAIEKSLTATHVYDKPTAKSAEIDYDRLARAITNALSNQQSNNNSKTEIIIHDRTEGGIKTRELEPINPHANSIFK